MTKLAALALALTTVAACGKHHHATPGKLTHADLDATMKMIVDAYPAPYTETFPRIVSELGSPMLDQTNLHSWFANDNGCWQLFVTESEHKAAANVMKAEPSDCK